VTAGPATGAHLLTSEGLARFDLPVGCGGVLLGADEQGGWVVVHLFRARPIQVVLVTAGYVARLFAVRALATGARVAVSTSRPQGWQPIVTSAPTGRAGLVAPGAPQPPQSTPGDPLLRCDDLGPGGAGVQVTLGAWQARVVVQDFTPASAVNGLRAFDLVVVQRVQPDLVQPLQAAFALPSAVAQALPRIPDDVVALLTPGQGVLARLAPTQIEASLLGTPVRHDG
jgi:hypothetical protein